MNVSEEPNWEWQLPTEIWLKIAQFLDLEGKYNLSLSCDRLHAICSEPKLWREQYIVITRSGRLAKMSPMGRGILENHGTHCRELIIAVFNSELTLDPETLRVLTQFKRVCSGVEKMIIQVTHSPRAMLQLSSQTTAFSAVVEILENAYGVANVVVNQWPRHVPVDDYPCMPCKALKSGRSVPGFCEDLTSMQVFSHVYSSSKLEVTSLFLYFCFPVRELQVCACVLSESLLRQLALPTYGKRLKFEVMKVNVDRCIMMHNFARKEPWQELIAAHVSLKVHLSVLLRKKDLSVLKVIMAKMQRQFCYPWIPVERVSVIFPQKNALVLYESRSTLQEIIRHLILFPPTLKEVVFMAPPGVWATSQATFIGLLAQLKEDIPDDIHVLFKELYERLIAKAKHEKTVEEEALQALELRPRQEDDDTQRQKWDSMSEGDIVFEKIGELEEGPLNTYCFRPPSADCTCPHCSPSSHPSRVWSDD